MRTDMYAHPHPQRSSLVTRIHIETLSLLRPLSKSAYTHRTTGHAVVYGLLVLVGAAMRFEARRLAMQRTPQPELKWRAPGPAPMVPHNDANTEPGTSAIRQAPLTNRKPTSPSSGTYNTGTQSAFGGSHARNILFRAKLSPQGTYRSSTRNRSGSDEYPTSNEQIINTDCRSSDNSHPKQIHGGASARYSLNPRSSRTPTRNLEANTESRTICYDSLYGFDDADRWGSSRESFRLPLPSYTSAQVRHRPRALDVRYEPSPRALDVRHESAPRTRQDECRL
ncbi:hypothetical protein SVAN01_01028 [Stagonosporopsis vannaccii]|nr:hypothetical protein SVAN01_01028 [Stagonosporopsis vannaccii]